MGQNESCFTWEKKLLLYISEKIKLEDVPALHIIIGEDKDKWTKQVCGIAHISISVLLH